MSTLADVLAAHRWVAFDMSWDACTGCDWRGKSRNEHAAHVVSAVEAAELAVIELPRPENRDGQVWRVLLDNEPEDVYLRESDDGTYIRISGFGEVHSLDAPALAAALLAAAVEVKA